MIYNDSYKLFLHELDQQKNREIYARITALSFSELPMETIEGRITGGSINIDGASAIRRSCSLTIFAQEFSHTNYYWGLNSKFKLEIGIKNTVNTDMPDIIWFNQGIYLLTTFNTNYSTTGYTIAINGKDKMGLLNGEIGGSLESSVDFGTIEEEEEDGLWHIKKIPIVEIIRNMVHTYAGEPYHNIIINDLDSYGLELLEYRYDTPMYLYRNKNENIYHNLIMENDELQLYKERGGRPISLKEIDAEHLDILVEIPGGEPHNPKPLYFKNGNNYDEYIFAKVEFGQTAGYRISDLIYAGDLIANVGESITSVLDKIKNMLVEFEYFYDLDGRFVFQKKQSFISTMWSPLKDEDDDMGIAESLAKATANAYVFNNNQIITAFNNTPNLSNLRNDYSVWGERIGVSGAAIPIHLRYAIDKKPVYYKNFAGNVFTNETTDWREIIYQMALDYYQYNTQDDFEIILGQNNLDYYPTGQTGYEKYYIDLQGFWRELYYPNYNLKLLELAIEQKEKKIRVNELMESLVSDEVVEYEKSLLDTINNKVVDCFTSILDYYYYDIPIGIQPRFKGIIVNENDLANRQNVFVGDFYLTNDGAKAFMANENKAWIQVNYEGEHKMWLRNVYEHPELINFWFDFLDGEGSLQQFNVKNIGSRSKAINETTIKSIYFRETPAVIFTNDINMQNKIDSYKYLQIPNDYIEEMFTISAQGKSAKDRLDELIYAHGYCIETISVTSLPIYYLDVNTRIYIHDDKSSVNGDYIVNKITLPLTYNGTMTISAIKAAENILY